MKACAGEGSYGKALGVVRWRQRSVDLGDGGAGVIKWRRSNIAGSYRGEHELLNLGRSFRFYYAFPLDGFGG